MFTQLGPDEFLNLDSGLYVRFDREMPAVEGQTFAQVRTPCGYILDLGPEASEQLRTALEQRCRGGNGSLPLLTLEQVRGMS